MILPNISGKIIQSCSKARTSILKHRPCSFVCALGEAELWRELWCGGGVTSMRFFSFTAWAHSHGEKSKNIEILEKSHEIDRGRGWFMTIYPSFIDMFWSNSRIESGIDADFWYINLLVIIPLFCHVWIPICANWTSVEYVGVSSLWPRNKISHIHSGFPTNRKMNSPRCQNDPTIFSCDIHSAPACGIHWAWTYPPNSPRLPLLHQS